jgi:hypothetical protein
MDFATDVTGQDDAIAVEKPEAPESDKKLVQRIVATIREDKRFHENAFKRMKRDMFVAKYGRTPEWSETNYTANIAGRHVKNKTGKLYAKNPKATVRRRPTIDYKIWDENEDSLKMAYQTMGAAQQQQQLAAQAPLEPHPIDGMPVQPPAPDLPPGFEQAQALIQDFMQGTQRRQEIQKVGKTLEILFQKSLAEQQPLDFKTAMKKLVRRACTTGVGYIEIGFQRETGPRPGLSEQLADAQTRLHHLERLAKEVAEGEIQEDDAEMAELRASIEALTNEPEIVMREGLILDFPDSTKVIPDRCCKSLVGFVGARHIAVEYLFTVDEVQEMFGVDIGKSFKPYTDGAAKNDDTANRVFDDFQDEYGPRENNDGKGLVCVWKYYDKPSGLAYYVADGHPEFLRPPAPPDVFVDSFWPVYALTFNDVEMEDELFPPSDVYLLRDMQMEYNRSRQGMREHRKASRPRWGAAKGSLSEADIEELKAAKPFDVILMDKDPQTKLSEILEVIPVPGVDPNLYETHQLFTDTQLVAGVQEAQLGGVSSSTATESAIAASSSASADTSAVDDLDAFLTVVCRASGQILLKEMSPDQVMQIVGPGAVWPDLTLPEIANEIYLEVEAGSTGKPNQAVEINNWKTMLPILLQIPGISPTFLAKEALRRLDDRLDLTEAFIDSIPSVVAQNQQSGAQQGPTGTGPASDPAAQGGAGANNAPQPPGQPGSDPAFGSNHGVGSV